MNKPELKINLIAIYSIVSLLVAGACCASETKEKKDRTGVEPGVYSFTDWLHVLREPDVVMDSEQAHLYKILKHPFVRGLSYRLNWKQLEPTPGGGYDKRVIKDYLEAVRSVCKKLNRPLPTIFFRFYPTFVPEWTHANIDFDWSGYKMVPGASTPPQAGVNALGMKVYGQVKITDAGEKLLMVISPSTDKAYQDKVKDMLRWISEQLQEHDPDAEIVKMVSLIGPSMASTSHTMRTNIHKYTPRKGEDKLGFGWTLERHFKAWEECLRYYGELPGFANRVWVFNLTNIPVTSDEKFGLYVSEQVKVSKVAAEVHPKGEGWIWYKTESLTARFRRANDWFIYKWNRPNAFAYRFLSRQVGRHGYETYPSHWYKRDVRWNFVYPHTEFMRLALFQDPYNLIPTKVQGTQFVEFWIDDFLQIDKIWAIDNGEPLAEWFERFDMFIRRYAQPGYKITKEDEEFWKENPGVSPRLNITLKPYPQELVDLEYK